MERKFEIEWVDAGSDPKHPPDPRFPNGIDIDISIGARPKCTADLPYPAKRCGLYSVRCVDCDRVVSVTTAGRVDDPKSVSMACKKRVFALTLTRHEERIATQIFKSYLGTYISVRDSLIAGGYKDAQVIADAELGIELIQKMLGGLHANTKRSTDGPKR